MTSSLFLLYVLLEGRQKKPVCAEVKCRPEAHRRSLGVAVTVAMVVAVAQALDGSGMETSCPGCRGNSGALFQHRPAQSPLLATLSSPSYPSWGEAWTSFPHGAAPGMEADLTPCFFL